MHTTRLLLIAFLVAVWTVPGARADRQRIAPGTALQDEVVVDTGLNGICETAAREDDLQAAFVGFGTSFSDAVRCGADAVANTVAAGDDVQLVAPGADCQNRNTIVVDTGADGIAQTAALADDVQIVPLGTAPPNTPCVLTGGNGIADTADPLGGDDQRLVPAGTALPNSVVVRCGPNRVVETRANNANSAGDDVQLLPAGEACQAANTPVVDSGANGIADTRAEGSDMVLSLKSTSAPLELSIAKKGNVSKTVKVVVQNVEFGATAPQARTSFLTVRDGTCPKGTVSSIDADTRVGGLQPSADVPLGKKVKGSFVVSFSLEDVTSVDKNLPFRCTINADVRTLDAPPAGDDAANPANNEVQLPIEVLDKGDLQ